MYGHSRTERKVKKFDDVSNRSWGVNVHRKRIWSDALDKFVRLKVQIRVLKTIDKVGGLDNYILGEKPARIKQLGIKGWDLRQQVLRTRKIRLRTQEERKQLGLPRYDPQEKEKRLQRRLEWMARTMADKYVRAVDTTPGESEDQALLDPKGYPDEAIITTPQTDEEPDLTQMAFDERIVYHANTIDTLAVDIALDARAISPSLPQPDLRSALHSISLLPLIKDAERSLPLRAPETYLLRSLTQLARKLSTTPSSLLGSARSRLADSESRTRHRLFTRYARLNNLSGPVISDHHAEIDPAIESGDFMPLYNEYLARQFEVRRAFNEKRAVKRQELAQKYYVMLKTSNAKGGKGIYRKRSAWHESFHRANKEVGHKATEWSPPPEGLTQGQWTRLLKAGKAVEGDDAAKKATAGRAQDDELGPQDGEKEVAAEKEVQEPAVNDDDVGQESQPDSSQRGGEKKPSSTTSQDPSTTQPTPPPPKEKEKEPGMYSKLKNLSHKENEQLRRGERPGVVGDAVGLATKFIVRLIPSKKAEVEEVRKMVAQLLRRRWFRWRR